MSVLVESVAERETKGRQRRKEVTAKSLHHTCQTIIPIPNDVQLTQNTHGETHDELLGLSGDNDHQQIKTLLPLLKEMPPL